MTSPSPLRILALDVGKRRIGLAATDATGTLVLPLQVLRRTNLTADLDLLLAVIDERRVKLLLLGMPRREDGSDGPMGREGRFLARKLMAARPSLRLATHDEAYSTVEAEQRLRERGMNARDQRRVIDAMAAVVILEDWLAAGGPEKLP